MRRPGAPDEGISPVRAGAGAAGSTARPATITDVARRAGVSLSTVSHVINGTRVVRESTIRLVEAAIAETGYRPNFLARALARSSTNTVGIAISAITNPYFSDIICAIERECARLGLIVLLSDTQDDSERELRVVQALHQRRVDGIIFAPSATPQASLTYLAESALPCVLVDRMPDPAFDQVGVDNTEAMQALIAHLIGHGHRRIGMVGGHPGFATTRERVAAFRATLRAHGIAPDPALIADGNATSDAATAATQRMLALPNPPSALATGNNMATIGVLRALRQLRLRVPEDVAVGTFDDFEWADCFEPQLTAIAQPCDDIGRRAASLLVERLHGGGASPRSVRLPCRLVIRRSCGCTSNEPTTPPSIVPQHV
jgi:LacI family transcriptional regulator